jgi:hypothetical protein
MPFRSQKQRSYFHYLKSQGKMDQATIDKWEEHTPKNRKLPERVEKKAMIENFWQGFSKRAVDNYVSTNSNPGAPEKLLKWNDHGGVDPRTPEEMQAAQAAMLVTLPPDIEGAKCGTCVHFRPITEELGHGFCTNPQIKMDVTDHMHCVNWSHPGVHDPVQAAEEEAQQDQFQQAMQAQQGMGGQPGMMPQPGMGGQPGMMPQSGMGAQGATPPESMQPGANMQEMYQAQEGPQGTGAQTQQPPAGQDMTMRPQTSPEAETTEGDTGQQYSPSSIGSENGPPKPKTSGNPMVEQAVQDFQGSGAVGGGLGQDNETPAPAKKPAEKKSGGKGHTININVSGEKEKTASVDFWKGIVEGY